jgi:ATP/ADP translocase
MVSKLMEGLVLFDPQFFFHHKEKKKHKGKCNGMNQSSRLMVESSFSIFLIYLVKSHLLCTFKGIIKAPYEIKINHHYSFHFSFFYFTG